MKRLHYNHRSLRYLRSMWLWFCLFAQAAESYRKGRWEFILSPQYTLSKNLGFEGGTTAKIEDTFGFAFQFGYNLNDHWNLAGLFSWSQPDYQALIQPVPAIPCRPGRATGNSKSIRLPLR